MKRGMGSGASGVLGVGLGTKLSPSWRRSSSFGRSGWEDRFCMSFFVYSKWRFCSEWFMFFLKVVLEVAGGNSRR